MSLGNLSVAPETQDQIAWFSASNFDEHVKVALAIANSNQFGNQNLRVDPIDPIPLGSEADMQEWLRAHYDMHSLVNGVLGIDGADLSSVDWNNRAELEAWTLLHFSEHQQWQTTLGTN